MKQENIFMLLISAIILLLITSCSQETKIKQMIDSANYCNTSDDCVLIGSKCPFDCYIYVNKAEADKVKPVVDAFDSKCVYSCIACPTVECVSNKCKPKCD